MATKTTQPVKGVLRTALAGVIGVAAAAGIVPAIAEAFPDIPYVKAIVGVAGIVSIGATGFFGSPAGNWLLSYVSLDRATVDKANTTATTIAAEGIPAAQVVVPEVEKVAADVKAVGTNPSGAAVAQVANDAAKAVSDAAPAFDEIISGLKKDAPAPAPAPVAPVVAPTAPVAEAAPMVAVPFTGGAPDPAVASETAPTPAT